MLKRFLATRYLFVIVAFGGFLGWKLIFPSGQLPKTVENQNRLTITAANIPPPPDVSNPDDSFKVYAVNVAHTAPFKKPFIGFGIYLGHGAVITAAQVVGHWPFFTNTRVLIAGQDLPAKVIKEGTVAITDLALLSVDETHLPVSLRLRRNPLCLGAIGVGTNVAVVIPQKVSRSKIVSPLIIAPKYRARFNTLIGTVENMGSGVFDVQRHCLLGIVSGKIEKFGYGKVNGRKMIRPIGYASYFVPASKIDKFIPPKFHF
jgi:hypothetical protein